MAANLISVSKSSMAAMQITLRIAICEDSDEDASLLNEYIEGGGAPVACTRFGSGEAFLSALCAGKFHLVFMDIYMGGITGVAAARALREIDEECTLVFTTISREHALEAFDAGAFTYLVKPIGREAVEAILKKRQKSVEQSGREVCRVNTKGVHLDIPLDKIEYIEAQNHNCLIHTQEGIVETGSSMKIEDFAALLGAPRFLRCHRAYVVNLDCIQDIGAHGDFLMKNGDTVYVRIRDGQRIRDAWLKHVYQEIRERRG